MSDSYGRMTWILHSMSTDGFFLVELFMQRAAYVFYPLKQKLKKVTILVSVSVVSGSIVFYCFFFNFSFGASDPIQKVFYILSFVRNYFFAWA